MQPPGAERHDACGHGPQRSAPPGPAASAQPLRRRRTLPKLPYYLRAVWALLRALEPSSLAAPASFGRRPLVFRDGLRLRAPTLLDVLVVVETVCFDCYGVARLDGSGPSLLVDVGAGIGDVSLFAARRFPDARIVAFEPDPGRFALLEENLRLNGAGNVRAERTAIGTAVSLPAAARVVRGERSDSPSVRVAALDDALEPGEVDLLKIDCEGAEIAVLEGGRRTLARTARVVVEYHRHLAEEPHLVVPRILREAGFELTVLPNRYDDATGLIFGVRRG